MSAVIDVQQLSAFLATSVLAREPPLSLHRAARNPATNRGWCIVFLPPCTQNHGSTVTMVHADVSVTINDEPSRQKPTG